MAVVLRYRTEFSFSAFISVLSPPISVGCGLNTNSISLFEKDSLGPSPSPILESWPASTLEPAESSDGVCESFGRLAAFTWLCCWEFDWDCWGWGCGCGCGCGCGGGCCCCCCWGFKELVPEDADAVETLATLRVLAAVTELTGLALAAGNGWETGGDAVRATEVS